MSLRVFVRLSGLWRGLMSERAGYSAFRMVLSVLRIVSYIAMFCTRYGRLYPLRVVCCFLPREQRRGILPDSTSSICSHRESTLLCRPGALDAHPRPILWLGHPWCVRGSRTSHDGFGRGGGADPCAVAACATSLDDVMPAPVPFPHSQDPA